MKKLSYILLGVLLGVAITASAGAYAASSGLIGSKVAGMKEVKLNGKSVGQAAIINNSSYLPVRAISEAMRLNIDLSGGVIGLNSSTPDFVQDPTIEEARLNDLQTKREIILRQINSPIFVSDLDTWRKAVPYYQNELLTAADFQKADLEAKLADAQKNLQDFEAKLADLQAQLAEIDAQIAALQDQQ
ncbi:hypothetical protein COLU111180_12655 [Cohnella lubricantis]|uniref:Copper amine oxidase-like N-terminal domain-containing protein n=1 Tax=Cohnella lubricantis TaxID=2163172 RepID=A0A841TDV8_9BACL|nr:hypothetical protein [Cohnella lubricantis]MBB6677420.1 hypothetical protein [Cohnella lubricantis]MBP2117532.1 hypothetical protein [Cohnella lubricantis]